jgi:hypothetical protein
MKTLETQFVSGDGGFGATPLTYNQVARDGNFAIYERSRSGKVKDFEVINIRILKAGTKIFQQTVAEDTERYPGTSQFGSYAWSFTSLGAAQTKLAKLVAERDEVKVEKKKEVVDGDGFMEALTAKMNLPKKQRGRKRKERPSLVYPTGNQWLMKDLLVLNKAWTQPLAYIQLQKDMKAGAVVEVARIKSASGRGRAAVAYRKV